jgi:hypothetical protein
MEWNTTAFMIGSSKELMLSNGSQAKLFEQLAHSKRSALSIPRTRASSSSARSQCRRDYGLKKAQTNRP